MHRNQIWTIHFRADLGPVQLVFACRHRNSFSRVKNLLSLSKYQVKGWYWLYHSWDGFYFLQEFCKLLHKSMELISKRYRVTFALCINIYGNWTLNWRFESANWLLVWVKTWKKVSFLQTEFFILSFLSFLLFSYLISSLIPSRISTWSNSRLIIGSSILYYLFSLSMH